MNVLAIERHPDRLAAGSERLRHLSFVVVTRTLHDEAPTYTVWLSMTEEVDVSRYCVTQTTRLGWAAQTARALAGDTTETPDEARARRLACVPTPAEMEARSTPARPAPILVEILHGVGPCPHSTLVGPFDTEPEAVAWMDGFPDTYAEDDHVQDIRLAHIEAPGAVWSP